MAMTEKYELSGNYNPQFSKKRHFFILKQRLQMVVLVLYSLIFLSISTLYFLNLLQWSRGPDFGWSIVDQMDKLVVTGLSGEAERAGLRVGDIFIGVNNQ